jgi:hypothetical protein
VITRKAKAPCQHSTQARVCQIVQEHVKSPRKHDPKRVYQGSSAAAREGLVQLGVDNRGQVSGVELEDHHVGPERENQLPSACAAFVLTAAVPSRATGREQDGQRKHLLPPLRCCLDHM